MKQFDSYLIYGCHFPSKSINLIKEHSSLKYFNNKLIQQYNCEILELTIPHYNNEQYIRYFLRIIVEQSDDGIINLDNLGKIDRKGFVDVLRLFEMDEMEPYLLSVPIVREL